MNRDDPRAQRSRARLRATILELVARKDPSTITMSEVARQAGVNRATVYQHCRDVDALITEAMEDAIGQLARAAARCPRDAPRHVAPPPLRELFTHVADHASVYQRMLGPQGSALFTTRMRERVTAELTESFRNGRRPPGDDDVPAGVHAAYLAGALLGVLADWITCDDAVPAEDRALAFWRLFRP